jgi:hypothetical protein
MSFHGAAKVQLRWRQLIGRKQYACVSLLVRQRAPAQAYGGCGGSLRGTRRARKRGMAATDFPPQGFRAAIDRASTSCEVSAMSE